MSQVTPVADEQEVAAPTATEELKSPKPPEPEPEAWPAWFDEIPRD